MLVNILIEEEKICETLLLLLKDVNNWGCGCSSVY